MKKLVVIVLVLTSFRGFSQGMKGIMDKIHFGLKAGGNYSSFNNAGFSSDPLYGFHAGMMIEFRFTDRISIHEDILFSTQGAKLKDATTFGKDQLQISYVSLPILFRYTTKSGFYLEAGPQVNMNVHSNLDNNADLKKYIKKVDYGAAAGLGYQSKIGLGIGVRYYAGLADVADFKLDQINTNFTNQVAQVSLFYTF